MIFLNMIGYACFLWVKFLYVMWWKCKHMLFLFKLNLPYQNDQWCKIAHKDLVYHLKQINNCFARYPFSCNSVHRTHTECDPIQQIYTCVNFYKVIFHSDCICLSLVLWVLVCHLPVICTHVYVSSDFFYKNQAISFCAPHVACYSPEFSVFCSTVVSYLGLRTSPVPWSFFCWLLLMLNDLLCGSYFHCRVDPEE